MSSKDTQERILAAALELFNSFGSEAVSLSRIATAANISKGNLHYHYSSKSSVILDIFSHIQAETWWPPTGQVSDVSLNLTEEMFNREWTLTWRYRFFYRELNHLLSRDPVLRSRFTDFQARRVREGRKWLDALVAAGVFRPSRDEEEFDLLSANTWLLSTYWLNYVETFNGLSADHAIERGRRVLMKVIEPYLTTSTHAPAARAMAVGHRAS